MRQRASEGGRLGNVSESSLSSSAWAVLAITTYSCRILTSSSSKMVLVEIQVRKTVLKLHEDRK